MRKSDPHGLRGTDEDSCGPGWRNLKEDPHTQVFSYVSTLEADLAGHFDKMCKMEYLYNPTDPKYGMGEEALSIVNENVVATSAETIVAGIETNNLRLRVLTDGGSWSEQRKAKRLEIYAEGLDKQIGPVDYGEELKWAFLKGSSFRYVGIEAGAIVRPHVPANEIYFDAADCHYGVPNQLHWLTLISKDRLKAFYPKSAKAIEKQGESSSSSITSVRARSLLTTNTQVALLRSWVLPIGQKGKKGYRVGRLTHCIESATLLDEEWTEDFYPFGKIDWSKTEADFLGISGAERISGTQRALNRRNWQIERGNDRAVMPVTYVDVADANMTFQSKSQYAATAVYKGRPPLTVDHPAVKAETYQSRVDLKNSALEEVGVSRLAAHSLKPAGIDSGVGLREYRDQTTERFSTQEAAVEAHFVRISWLTLWCCKQLGAAAPKIPRQKVFPSQKPLIEFRDVDMLDVKTQLSAASNLPRTAAGRQQLVLEWAQAGLISKDAALRMLNQPDVEREVSLFSAALEQVEWCLEMIAEGHDVVPEPFMNLQLAVTRGQQQYLVWQTTGAPEEVLEELRDFVTLSAYMLSEQQKKQQQGLAPPAGPDAAQMQQAPSQAMTGMMPALPPG